MKKMLILILILNCFPLIAGNLVLNYTQGLRKRNINCVLETDKVKNTFSLTQSEDGLFNLRIPPVFYFEKDQISLGQIKFSQGRIIRTNTPSLRPEYSGIAFCQDLISIAAFSPVFSPTSPYGAFFSIGNNKTYFSVLYENNNKNTADASINTYKINWSETKTQGIKIKTHVNLSNSFSNLRIDTEIGQFTGIKTRADFSLFFRGFGFATSLGDGNLKTFSFSVGKDTCLNLSYTSFEGTAPVYGGTSQEALFSLKSELQCKNWGFETESSRHYKYTTGYVSETSYALSFKTKTLFSKAKIIYSRTKGSPAVFKLDVIEFQTPYMILYITDKGLNLSISRTFHLNGHRIKLSVNQDRELSFSTGISF